jgi:hypothetical protein
MAGASAGAGLRRTHVVKPAKVGPLRDNRRWRCYMGDKGKKDKEKGQKQHAAKDKQEDKRKLEKQPKRTA